MVLLSPRAAQAAPSHSLGTVAEPTIALVSEDLYAVMTERDTLGYVLRVGSVYVALSGDIYSHAVEVGQSLDWNRAVRMVLFA